MYKQATVGKTTNVDYLGKFFRQQVSLFVDVGSINTGPLVQPLKQIHGFVHVHGTDDFFKIFIREASVVV